jgi:hypothetical protein
MENKMGSVMGVSNDKPKSKEERISDFVKSIQALEQAMEPFKEQKRDLRKNYVDNNWLSKEEMRSVVKAYRLMKDETDMDELLDMYKKVKGA